MKTRLFALVLLAAVSCGNAEEILTSKDIDIRSEKLKKQILKSKSRFQAGGTTYYVSSDGCDENDGLSPEKAFRTLDKVNSTDFVRGDVVLFRRGDLWRGQIRTCNGVTYSAYGSGEKPKLYGSPFDAAVTGEWRATDVHDVYAFSIPLAQDVGTLVFNEGRDSCAFKVIQKMYPDSSLFHIDTDEPFTDYHDLKRNLDFFHDPNDRTVYLKCDKGNPADVYSSIELNTFGHGFKVSGGSATIDNFCIRYVGSHGVGAVFVDTLVVTNCEIGWIGGSIQCYNDLKQDTFVSPTRFGNGIELWGKCDSYLVENNYIYEIYDAGMTHQYQYTGGNDKVVMKNVTYRNNLLEKCVYGLEYFLGDPEQGDTKSYMENVLVEGNIIRFTGSGWGGQRPHKRTPAVVKSWRHPNRAFCFEMKGNIFDDSWPTLMQIRAQDSLWLPDCHDNVYLMRDTINFGESPERNPRLIIL